MEVVISAPMMSYGRAGMMIVGDTLTPCLAPIYPTMLFAANIKQDPLMNCHFTVLNHKQVDNMFILYKFKCTILLFMLSHILVLWIHVCVFKASKFSCNYFWQLHLEELIVNKNDLLTTEKLQRDQFSHNYISGSKGIYYFYAWKPIYYHLPIIHPESAVITVIRLQDTSSFERSRAGCCVFKS